jgi:hypothetical protein
VFVFLLREVRIEGSAIEGDHRKRVYISETGPPAKERLVGAVRPLAVPDQMTPCRRYSAVR